MRLAGMTRAGKPFVMLGLEDENIRRLLEGKPIRVNLRNLDPDGPPVDELPDLELFIAAGPGLDQIEAFARKAEEGLR